MSDCSRRRFRVLNAAEEAVGTGAFDALVVNDAANVRYLTGFTGTNGWAVLTPDAEAALLTDPRYAEQAEREVDADHLVVTSKGLVAALDKVRQRQGWKTLAFDPEHVSVALRRKLAEALEIELVEVSGTVEIARRRKDAAEVEAIRAALQITEAALTDVAAAITPGQTEKQIAADLEYACRRRGADGMAFETIVASGPRTALPHGVAGERSVQASEPVMIDMGCRLGGYCSDITRMVWCGDAPDVQWLRIHSLVDTARRTAVAAVRAGMPAVDLDHVARAVIAAAGHAEDFSHGTGHGVGLEIHESPGISQRSKDTLEQGMVATVEPGVYVAGRFGVRIEDMVCVGESECERLTTLSTKPILAGAP